MPLKHRLVIIAVLFAAFFVSAAFAQSTQETNLPTLEQLKAAGALRSRYRKSTQPANADETRRANLKEFREHINPVLEKNCYECHGPKVAEAELRIDMLDPDLIHGDDAEKWLEVMGVVNNGEMPPEDGPELSDDVRAKIVSWLASEIQSASRVSRAEQRHSSFRRMTKYEYNYALQDLLGLQLNFAEDLPPEPASEDGFKNSSEVLQMTASQYGTYLETNRNALNQATVRGERPEVLYWGVSAKRASASKFRSLKEASETRSRGNQRSGREKRGAYYKNAETGQTAPATWTFRRAVNAWAPTSSRPKTPSRSEYIAVLPAGERLVVDLGNRLPDEGILRVRVRAWRTSAESKVTPSLALDFGWQGSNNSKSSVEISERDLAIDAPPEKPQFYQWDIPLSEIYPRNPVRKTVELGAAKLTNPSEYIRLHNTSISQSADIEFDYVEVSAPVYEEWPPASHKRIFIESKNAENEAAYARQVVSQFMMRAWRREVADAEIDRKMKFFAHIRPDCEDFQHAVIEVLATVLSSPRFLYLVQSDGSTTDSGNQLDEFELATRLSMFLWCSIPDGELLELAAKGRLSNAEELARQTRRMLADPRHERFSRRFVRQWLGLELLDFLKVDESSYPEFDSDLHEAMQQEPIAFFEELLQNDYSVMDFLHADYSLVNERLARHYGVSDIYGNEFQKAALIAKEDRGGLLTMAGILAMNSDGSDSHPLKRGIWLLESILNDPPPPPPPAVPEIDLADPEILKLSLKERLEDHRNKAACNSCHAKIDPWGIAFENFDAVGTWRTHNRGKEVDATSRLYNQQELNGADGLKRFLLANRQDQFARAIVHKMTTFALGRPLTFSDRASVDRLTAELRRKDDGLATLITLIATSDIFKSR